MGFKGLVFDDECFGFRAETFGEGDRRFSALRFGLSTEAKMQPHFGGAFV